MTYLGPRFIQLSEAVNQTIARSRRGSTRVTLIGGEVRKMLRRRSITERALGLSRLLRSVFGVMNVKLDYQPLMTLF